MSAIVCQHGSGSTYTNLNPGSAYEWWVCSTCHLPSEGWLRAQGETVLNYFVGGVADGLAYETKFLLSPESFAIPIQEYVWTPEIITSEKTGAQARVWKHHTLVDGASREELTPAEQVVNGSGGRSPAVNNPVTGGHDMAKKTTEASLEDKRKSFKLSRAQVAEKAGITAAQVYRIEKGGPRTTEEETALVSKAIDELGVEVSDPS